MGGQAARIRAVFVVIHLGGAFVSTTGSGHFLAFPSMKPECLHGYGAVGAPATTPTTLVEEALRRADPGGEFEEAHKHLVSSLDVEKVEPHSGGSTFIAVGAFSKKRSRFRVPRGPEDEAGLLAEMARARIGMELKVSPRVAMERDSPRLYAMDIPKGMMTLAEFKKSDIYAKKTDAEKAQFRANLEATVNSGLIWRRPSRATSRSCTARGLRS
jgi:hypothetical protein